jgi:hypothetical protein
VRVFILDQFSLQNLERQAQAGDLIDERMARGELEPDEEDEAMEEGGEEPGAYRNGFIMFLSSYIIN